MSSHLDRGLLVKLGPELLNSCLRWQTLLLLITCGGVFLVVYNRYGRGLHKVPGPFFASISSFWKFYILWREVPHHLSVALHEKHGPLVRIGPYHISAASPEAVNAIYMQKKGFKKTDSYSILQPLWEGEALHNVFSTQDQAQHTALKRSIGNLYSTSAVLNYEPNLDRSLTTFVQCLRNYALPEPRPIDTSAWLQFWAFDALGEVNFSCPLGFLTAGKDIDGICRLDQETMNTLWGQIPKIERFISRLATWTKVLAPNPLLDLTLKTVGKRSQEPTEDKDMLNGLNHRRQKKPESLSSRQLLGAAYINVSIYFFYLRAILYYLCKTQRCYNELISNIRRADFEGRLSTPVKYTEALDILYLAAVINETLRIHPSTGILFKRYVPSEGLVLHNQYLPPGTIIGVNAWVMNRNKSIYGVDVETFRPERWIDQSSEKLDAIRKCLGTVRLHFAATPAEILLSKLTNANSQWGYGARNCIGKNLAMIQINKLLVEIYRNFDVQLAQPEKDWDVAGSWLTTQTNMDMLFTAVA